MDELLWMGVDYGSRKASVAVIGSGGRIVLLEDLVLSQSRRDLELLVLSEFVVQAVEALPGAVSSAAVEAAILGRSLNAQTLANLGYTAGAITTALALCSIPTELVPSATWKKQALGNGAANKDDVMAWANSRWPRRQITTQDQADALGLATYARLKEVT